MIFTLSRYCLRCASGFANGLLSSSCVSVLSSSARAYSSSHKQPRPIKALSSGDDARGISLVDELVDLAKGRRDREIYI